MVQKKKNKKVNNNVNKVSNEPKWRKTAWPKSGSVKVNVLTKEDADNVLGTISKDETIDILKSKL